MIIYRFSYAMGVSAIVNTIAFPKDVPKTPYNNLIKDLIKLTSGNNRIYAALYRPRNPSNKVIVHCHANGETLYFLNTLMQTAAKFYKVNLLVFDWEGYGMSEGKANETTLLRSAEAVYQYAL